MGIVRTSTAPASGTAGSPKGGPELRLPHGEDSCPVTHEPHTIHSTRSDTQPSRFALHVCKASWPLPFGNSAFGTSCRTAPHHTTPCRTAPRHSTPLCTTPHQPTPHHTTPHQPCLRYTAPHQNMVQHATPCMRQDDAVQVLISTRAADVTSQLCLHSETGGSLGQCLHLSAPGLEYDKIFDPPGRLMCTHSVRARACTCRAPVTFARRGGLLWRRERTDSCRGGVVERPREGSGNGGVLERPRETLRVNCVAGGL